MRPDRVLVAASFWSSPRDRVLAETERLARAGLTRVHWDHTDGQFARPGGFTAQEALAITEATGVAAEAHLMVQDPLPAVDAWTEFSVRVVVHAGTHRWREALERIQHRGVRAGVAVAGGEPAPEVGEDVDVLVMSITPGEAGSTFRPSALETVRASVAPARAVGLDGGVTAQIVPGAVAAGARWLVSGTDLVSSADPAQWLRAARL